VVSKFEYIYVPSNLFIYIFIPVVGSDYIPVEMRSLLNPLYLPLAEASPCGDLEWCWGDVFSLPPQYHSTNASDSFFHCHHRINLAVDLIILIRG